MTRLLEGTSVQAALGDGVYRLDVGVREFVQVADPSLLRRWADA